MLPALGPVLFPRFLPFGLAAAAVAAVDAFAVPNPVRAIKLIPCLGIVTRIVWVLYHKITQKEAETRLKNLL